MAKLKQKFDVLKKNVVEPGYCVGCGTCVSMCMHDSISISFNSIGQYEPFYKNEDSCTSCGLCVKVCPFENSNANEDDISKSKFGIVDNIDHNEHCGYFLDSFVGFADDKTRLNGASGGGVSDVLKHLLSEKLVDKIITVEPTKNRDKFFQYTIISTLKDVDRCAKSAYYPVEISGVLEQVRKSNDRFAIVGLPCVLKAVELAKITFPKIRRNIVFSLGLVCGQIKSKRYTDYLINDLGLETNEVNSVSFRKKFPDAQSCNFAFEVSTLDGKKISRKWRDGVSPVWINDFFKQKSCYHCDDVFAECADAVFMDAWLDDYYDDYKGTSIIISRNSILSGFFNQSTTYSEFSIERAIESQMPVVINKRAYRKIFDDKAKEQSSTIPNKREFNYIRTVDEKTILQKYDNAVMSRNASFKDVKKRIRTIKGSLFKRVVRRFKRITGK